MITPSGFVTHNIGNRLGGDIASAGDIAHIALLLWDWCRDPRLLDDAERIVRCRLLPAQVRETLPLKPARDEFATRESVTFDWRGDEICGVDWVGGYLEPFAKACR